MLKWITPVALAAVLGAVAAPAEAQRYDRDDRYDRRGNYSGRYDRFDRGGQFIRMNDGRLRRRGFQNDARREELAERANRLAQRIDNLHDRGRLSASHRSRAFEKLERIRDHVMNDPRLDDRQYRADVDWMESIERDVENWSSGRRR